MINISINFTIKTVVEMRKGVGNIRQFVGCNLGNRYNVTIE